MTLVFIIVYIFSQLYWKGLIACIVVTIITASRLVDLGQGSGQFLHGIGVLKNLSFQRANAK